MMPLKQILVVNMNYLGDALMTTPALEALRQAYPSSRIDVIAGAAHHYGAFEVLQGHPHIDRLIKRNEGGSTTRVVQLFRLIRENAYDLVVILPSIPAYAFVARLALARSVIIVPPADGTRHMADHFLHALSERLPISPKGHNLTLRVSEEASLVARRFLPAPSLRKSLVAVNVGASRPQKRWPLEHFVEAIRLLNARGMTPALLGGDNREDLAAAADIRAALEDERVGLIDLVGKTTLQTLAAVLLECDALMTADTGAMHIASAVGTPIVAIFGSTDPHLTGPYGDTPARVLYKNLPCAPCNNHPTCGGRHDCLQEISPEEVVLAVSDLIRRKRILPIDAMASQGA